MMQNKKASLYLTLLTPSAIGAVFYTFAAAVIIFLNQFSFIQQHLQIPRNVDFMRMFLSWLDTVVTSHVGENSTNAIVVGMFWAFVGLAVYVFLRGVAGFITDLAEGLDGRRYLWPKGSNRNRALMEAAQRVIFRIFAFFGLVFVVLVPLARLVGGPVFVDAIGPNAYIKIIVWFLLAWLTMHIVVVLTRLIALRPRLFN
jgi:hypothetical protein